MKKLFTLLAMAVMAIGANAQTLIAERDFTGITDSELPRIYGSCEGVNASLSSDADGLAITVNSQISQMGFPTIEVFPRESLNLKPIGSYKGCYKVVITAKFPTNGGLMMEVSNMDHCSSSAYVTATGDFQEFEMTAPVLPFYFDGEDCNLSLHWGDFNGTTILKKVQLYEMEEDVVDEIDDVLYYLDKGSKTAAVAGTDDKYGHKYDYIDIPATVTYDGEAYTVTKIMDHAIQWPYLKSVTIPNTVTEIGNSAFAGIWDLKEITIPASVKVIYPEAFGGCGNLKRVIVQAETPPIAYESSFNISYGDTSRDYKIILKVPDASIDVYKATAPWSTFSEFEMMSKQKCEKPTISVESGKLNFGCDTEDVEFHYEISILMKGDGNGVKLPETLKISVYASKEGFYDSEVETAEISTQSFGDVNGDGVVNGTDIQEIINIIVNE